MTFLLDIVTHTPAWVWAILGVLVLLGLRQTQAQTITAQRLVVVPLVMGGWSLLGTWNAFAAAGPWLAVAGWIAGALAGFASNRALDLPRNVSANGDGSFRVGGSVAPLVLFVSIFLCRYALGVTLAIAPALRQDMLFATIASFAIALPAGLLAARSRKVLGTRAPGGLAAA